MSIADRICNLLREQDMSVSELSRKSGVSRTAIDNIMSGYSKPGISTKERLASGFGITVAEMLTGVS